MKETPHGHVSQLFMGASLYVRGVLKLFIFYRMQNEKCIDCVLKFWRLMYYFNIMTLTYTDYKT